MILISSPLCPGTMAGGSLDQLGVDSLKLHLCREGV